jgi:hypothetical protein
VDRHLRVPPNPYLSDAETSIDFKLVDSAARPNHFDRKVGGVLTLIADEITLLGLEPALLRCVLERPGAVWREVDPALEGIGLDEAPM